MDEGHRDHDAVAAAVRSRYWTPAPTMGYLVESRPYGVLATLGGARRAIVGVDDLSNSDIAVLLADDVTQVWVEDRQRDELVTPRLASAGYEAGPATTYRALVGGVRAVALSGLVLKPVSDPVDFAWRKLTYFADGSPPSEDDLAREMATREGERDLADFYLVEVNGVVASILAAYRGEDVTAYLLASDPTRRGVGVGSGALAAWVKATPARSHVINALDGGRPEQLYRRLGFTDEVYWYRRFERA